MTSSEFDAVFTHHTVQAGSLAMHCVEGGQGTPLLLLHGFPQHWWMWRKVMPALARHLRVIAVDQRGMGGTAITADGYDKTTLANDLHALMAKLGVGRAHVCGYDLGGGTAYAYASLYPDAVDRLVTQALRRHAAAGAGAGIGRRARRRGVRAAGDATPGSQRRGRHRRESRSLDRRRATACTGRSDDQVPEQERLMNAAPLVELDASGKKPLPPKH